MINYKKFGFTLAEVIITLGIIGVVAAMTMPSLMTKIRHRTLASQFKKTYAELNQAAQLFAENEGASVTVYAASINDTSAYSNTTIEKFMTYFKGTSKNGQSIWNVFDPAHNIQQRNLNGSLMTSYPCDRSVVHSDIGGRLFATDDPPHMYNLGYGPKICVDINGTSAPNRMGYDRFVFVFTENNTVVPYVGSTWNTLTPQLTNDEEIAKYCSYAPSSTPAHACAYFALKDKSPDGNGTYWGKFLK